MATKNDIQVYKGEAPTFQFTMLPAVDITGWTITLTIKANAVDTLALLTVTPASLVTPASGVFKFVLTHAQLLALGVGMFAYDVQRVDVGSEAVLSIGSLEITQEVLY